MCLPGQHRLVVSSLDPWSMPRGGGRKLAEAHWRFLYRAAVAEAQSLRPLIIDVGSSGCTHIYIYIFVMEHPLYMRRSRWTNGIELSLAAAQQQQQHQAAAKQQQAAAATSRSSSRKRQQQPAAAAAAAAAATSRTSSSRQQQQQQQSSTTSVFEGPDS